MAHVNIHVWNGKILFRILMLLREDKSVLVGGWSGEWGWESSVDMHNDSVFSAKVHGPNHHNHTFMNTFLINE